MVHVDVVAAYINDKDLLSIENDLNFQNEQSEAIESSNYLKFESITISVDHKDEPLATGTKYVPIDNPNDINCKYSSEPYVGPPYWPDLSCDFTNIDFRHGGKYKSNHRGTSCILTIEPIDCSDNTSNGPIRTGIQSQIPSIGTDTIVCQVPPKCPPMDAVGTFGLPAGNKKTSDYNVMRVYLKNGEVHTIPPGGDPYKMYPGQVNTVRTHEGVDFSSRDSTGKGGPVPFEAGVSGTVYVVPGSKWNTVSVTTSDGSQIQYLHASSISVKTGDKVGPDTVIGMTGNKSPTPVATHLHVQAKDPKGKAIDPQILIDKENKARGICK